MKSEWTRLLGRAGARPATFPKLGKPTPKFSKLCNRLARWTVAEDHPRAWLDVAGTSSKPIGTDSRFGQLWVGASSTNQPTVAGTNFWAQDVEVGAGTQQVVAAIRDAAGNVGRATNSVVVRVATAASYAYSTAGCLTNISYGDGTGSLGVGLTWNGQYQLTATTSNGSAAEQFGYDALGRRIWTASGGVTTYSVYDGAQVIADVTAGGALLRSYTWGPGIDNLLALTVHTGTTARTYYAIKDHLGSVHALVDAAGSIVEQYRFDAWGRTTVYDGVGTPLAQSAIGNRYVWQGREISWATGLYYFRARWYDSVTGRWLSNDPIGISGGLNQFVFCGNDPVNYRDPAGLQSWMSPGYGSMPNPMKIVPANMVATTPDPSASFVNGVAFGAVVAVVVVGAAPVAVSGLTALGLSSGAASAIVTGGLGTAAAAGGVATVRDIANNAQAGNWNNVAYDLGTLTGGFIVGVGGGGRAIAEGIMGQPSPAPNTWNPFTVLKYELSARYQSGYPDGSWSRWMASAPTPASGGAAAEFTGSGVSLFLRSPKSGTSCQSSSAGN